SLCAVQALSDRCSNKRVLRAAASLGMKNRRVPAAAIRYILPGRQKGSRPRDLIREGNMRVGMWIFAAVVASAAAILSGQTFGEITGEVRDSTGAVVTTATVNVTNDATGASRMVVTNEVGVYTFPSLPPGVYRLKVTAQGFQVVKRPGIDLQVQQTARIDFTL